LKSDKITGYCIR